jgi:thiol-disulfide isomerase/thioredoxin
MTAKQLFLLGVLSSGSVIPAEASAESAILVQQLTSAATQAASARELSALGSATEWINSPPLTAAELRGKVVLVEFWTYTCINWLRSLPYVRAWAARYKDRGLVVIGVHAPEFGFERDPGNVSRAVKAMAIAYPVVIDNDNAIWRAFDNDAWPALYFVDSQGRVRRRQVGEGEYEEAERFIQRLLTEAGARDVGRDLVSVKARDAEAAADWAALRSPETYIGRERGERFASPGGAVRDEQHGYAVPPRLALNQWALAGAWTVGDEAAVLNAPSGRIVYRFHARDLHLVMGPAARGTPVRFRVLLDGRPPGTAHGSDVDEQGQGTVTDQRLYQLIRQGAPIADRQFEIEFLDPRVEAFAFTFG